MKVIIDVYKSYTAWLVTYKCCPPCPQKCRKIKKIEQTESTDNVERFEDLGETVIRHGVTNSNAFSVNPEDRWCSECPKGIGKPM